MKNQIMTVGKDTFAGRLIADCQGWQAYTHHDFVEQLGKGDLPQENFEYYLVQDYLFLIHFSRAWALAAFKAQTISDIRTCSATVQALINDEIKLHVEYCQGFGLSEAQMAGTLEHPANIAYTRYVMERGIAGDLLDLIVALAPCVIGYGEIGARLCRLKIDNNHPYKAWIDMYSGDGYQSVVDEASIFLDRIAADRLGARQPELQATFDQATRLEVGFWDMAMIGSC